MGNRQGVGRRGSTSVLGATIALTLMTLASAGKALAAANQASASCTRSWAAVGDGNWNDASKWTPSGVPRASDDVCITHAGRYTVTVDHNVSARNLTLGTSSGVQTLKVTAVCDDESGLTLSDDTMTIAAAGVLTFVNEKACHAYLGINFKDEYGGTLRNHGHIQLFADQTDSNADIDNFGVLTVHPKALWVGANLTNEATGVFQYYMPTAGAEMVLDDASLGGTLQVVRTAANTGNGWLFVDGNVNNHFAKYVDTHLDQNGLYIHECICDGDYGLMTTRANVIATPSSGKRSSSVHLHGTLWPHRGAVSLSFKDSHGTTTSLGTLSSTPSGTFDVTKTVPASAATGAGAFIVGNNLYGTTDTAVLSVS